MQLNRIYILSLLVLCAVASASAQPLRVNRHQLRVEGIAFQRVSGISEDNYLYVEDFSIMAGETKTVPVYLHGTRPMWTFQLDVNTTGGLVVDDACLSGSFAASSAGGQFSFDCGTVGSAFRIVVYNQQKTMSITPSDRLHVIDLTITAPANATAADASILLQNFEFIDATTNRGVVGTDKSCQVHVLPRFAESITLNKTAIEMPVGSAEQLTATVLPDDLTDKSVAWSSSDPAIATVDASGLVTAVAVGTATVTATTTDGTALTASCQVTVSQPEVQVGGLELSEKVFKLQLTQSRQVNVTTEGMETVTWSSSDAVVASVDANGVVTAHTNGIAIITATAANGASMWCGVVCYLRGDIDESNHVDSQDVNTVINIVLGKN